MASQPNSNAAAARAAEPQPSGAERGEGALVIAAITEGVILAVWLVAFPWLALRMGGFPPSAAFFVRWAGVLHVVLAIGYALDWLRFRRTTLIVVAKGATALFLVAAWIVDGLPPLMIFAIVLESTMAAAGALLHGPAQRSRQSRARLRLVTPVHAAIRPAGRQ